MSQNDVTLTLTSDEALVLFELVARFAHHEKLAIEDQAEEQVLWNVCALLEKRLVEPFRHDYDSLLERARSALRYDYD